MYIKDAFKENHTVDLRQKYDFLLVSNSKEVEFFGENLEIGELIWLYKKWTLANNFLESVSNDSSSDIKLKGEEGTQIIVFVKPTE